MPNYSFMAKQIILLWLSKIFSKGILGNSQKYKEAQPKSEKTSSICFHLKSEELVYFFFKTHIRRWKASIFFLKHTSEDGKLVFFF